MHITLRTPEMETKYQAWLKEPKDHKCCFCREELYWKNKTKTAITHDWKHWHLMRNDFPYDKVFGQHDLLFCKRHVDWSQLTVEEVEEYAEVLKLVKPKYQQLLENIGDRISQPSHFHIHLAKFL